MVALYIEIIGLADETRSGGRKEGRKEGRKGMCM